MGLQPWLSLIAPQGESDGLRSGPNLHGNRCPGLLREASRSVSTGCPIGYTGRGWQSGRSEEQLTKLRPVLRSLVRDSPLEGALLQSYHAVRERLLRPLSDEEFAQRMYRSSARASLNLKNPVTFDEKQWWLKINYRDPLMTTCTDKITVREYVRQCGLGETLWPLLGVFDTPSQIPWDDLPKDFYLKTNHSSATNMRVAGAGASDRQRLERRLARHLRRKHYPLSREWNYLGIKPRILAEPMLPTGGPRGLVDYRFFCSYGQVNGIFVDIGTADTNGNHASSAQRNVYDAGWTLLPVKVSRPRIGEHDAPQPFDADKVHKVTESCSPSGESPCATWVKAKPSFGSSPFSCARS